MSEREKKRSASLESLIADEWEILRSLKDMMENPELSIQEKLSTANALAYHASVFSKLLTQKGADAELNEATLGDFIRDVQPRITRRGRMGFRRWMRRLSLKR
ncbi:MAG: hypothetical protein WCD81_09640 [Candidatus Bathyarchaeia archaeon]